MDAIRPRRRRETTREKILDSALSLVAKHGPDNLTLTAVVRHSGVHRATIYQHFSTREDVLQAASERFAAKFYKEVLETMKGPDEPLPAGRALVKLTNGFADFVMENPDLGQIWLQGLLNSPDPSKDPVWREYEGSFRRLLGSEVAQPNLDSEVISIMILSGTILWPLWARAHTKTAAGRKRFARRFTKNLLRVALYGTLRPEYFPDAVSYIEKRSKKPWE